MLLMPWVSDFLKTIQSIIKSQLFVEVVSG